MHNAFCTFVWGNCTTTTWKCLISRFVEDLNTRQRLSLSFPEVRCSLLEFNSRKIWQHLTNSKRWNKGDKVWSSANSLYKGRFRSLRRRCCLSSLINHCIGMGVNARPVSRQFLRAIFRRKINFVYVWGGGGGWGEMRKASLLKFVYMSTIRTESNPSSFTLWCFLATAMHWIYHNN